MKHASILVIAALLYLAGNCAYAHSPKEIDMEFNMTSQTLVLEVDHGVIAPSAHYVSRVQIWVNERPPVEKTFEKQDTKKSLKAEIPLKAIRKGDEIKVKAHCNIAGDKTATLMAGEEKPAAKEEEADGSE
ncbi:MAG: hypothetical protein ACLFUS_17350 [Candidatus Sumerlaeia bacterium]